MRHAAGPWSVGEHLLAGVLDALNWANWQREGDKRKPQPERVPRPDEPQPHGQQEEASQSPSSGQGKAMFGGQEFEMDSLSIEEMDKWLGRSPVAA